MISFIIQLYHIAEFNSLKDSLNNFNLIYHNIRSFNNNFDILLDFLETLVIKFGIIVSSEFGSCCLNLITILKTIICSIMKAILMKQMLCNQYKINFKCQNQTIYHRHFQVYENYVQERLKFCRVNCYLLISITQ